MSKSVFLTILLLTELKLYSSEALAHLVNSPVQTALPPDSIHKGQPIEHLEGSSHQQSDVFLHKSPFANRVPVQSHSIRYVAPTEVQDLLRNVPAAARYLEREDVRSVPLHVNYNHLEESEVKHFIDTCPEQLRDLIMIYKRVFSNVDDKLAKKAMQRKIILVGPPGVGKSMLSQAIAQECGVRCIVKSAASIPNEYKNSGITKLDELFLPLFDEKEPIFLILEELSGLTERHGTQNNPDSGMIEHFLTLLDRCDRYCHIVVIMNINQIKQLPEPLKSRLHGGIIEIDYPTLAQRESIIRFHVKDCPSVLTEEEIKIMAHLCGKLSGREIEHMVRLAAAKVIKKEQETITAANEQSLRVRFTQVMTQFLSSIRTKGAESVQAFKHTTLALLMRMHLYPYTQSRGNLSLGDLNIASKQVYGNRIITAQDAKEMREFLKTAFPYVISVAGLGLTITGLYWQWKAHQQQKLFHDGQMMQALTFHNAQMAQTVKLQIENMLFNLAMHAKNAQEQVYKEAFQLYLRMYGANVDPSTGTKMLARALIEGKESIDHHFDLAQSTAELAAENARKYAHSDSSQMIQLVREASTRLIETKEKNTGAFEAMIKEPSPTKLPSQGEYLINIVFRPVTSLMHYFKRK